MINITDVSRHQGDIVWEALTSFFNAVWIRAGMSWGYEDPRFDLNWSKSRGKLPRGSYHVFFPLQDPKRQADKWLEILDGDYGELGLAADVELHHDANPLVFERNLRSYLIYLEDRTGIRPVIYSRASFFNAYITGSGRYNNPPKWYQDYDWWLAQYLRNPDLRHPGPVTLPIGVPRERVLIHQDSGSGVPIGVQSRELDYNHWEHTARCTLQEFIHEVSGTPEPTPEEPEPVPNQVDWTNIDAKYSELGNAIEEQK